MARALRMEYPGACYHVINRGNYRRDLFAENGAANAFERALAQAAERFAWKLHAYVVMRNHFHLALEISEPNLSLGMKWLQGTWVRRYNGYRQLVGRPFQGRYKAILVEPGHAFAQVCHYIHLNPVRAGAATFATIGSYPHCSLKIFQSAARPKWLDPSTVLSAIGNTSDRASSWAEYGALLEVLSTDAGSRANLTSEKMSRGWCQGSPDFKKQAKMELARVGSVFESNRFEGIEREVVQREREVVWLERLEKFVSRSNLDLKMLSQKKSCPHKLLLAAAMKRSTSVSNRWLSTRLDLGCPRAIGRSVARWLCDAGNVRRLDEMLHAET